MATNRADTLDPALLRPGRLDRKIEFPVPDRRQKRLVFSTVTSKMNLSDEVDLEDYVARPDHISGADINSICQEVFNQISYFIIDLILILGWYASCTRKSLYCLGKRF
jgi:ATP-dependent 26S proteasome regulatory subunit